MIEHFDQPMAKEEIPNLRVKTTPGPKPSFQAFIQHVPHLSVSFLCFFSPDLIFHYPAGWGDGSDTVFILAFPPLF